MDFLDLHTHKTPVKSGQLTIQSLSLTEDVFLAMPKKKLLSIGLHPWHASIEKLELHMKYLTVLAKQDNVKMIGECGLDYDLAHYAAKEYQIKYFPFHFDLAQKYNKPMYLHNRNTGDDFYQLVRENRHKFNKGVV
ncbi:MAG: hypothetical protein EOP00_19820, partial [Pedobacter sp.]